MFKKNNPVSKEDMELLNSIPDLPSRKELLKELLDDFKKNMKPSLLSDAFIQSLDNTEKLAVHCSTLKDRLVNAKDNKQRIEKFFEKMHEEFAIYQKNENVILKVSKGENFSEECNCPVTTTTNDKGVRDYKCAPNKEFERSAFKIKAYSEEFPEENPHTHTPERHHPLYSHQSQRKWHEGVLHLADRGLPAPTPR